MLVNTIGAFFLRNREPRIILASLVIGFFAFPVFAVGPKTLIISKPSSIYAGDTTSIWVDAETVNPHENQDWCLAVDFGDGSPPLSQQYFTSYHISGKFNHIYKNKGNYTITAKACYGTCKSTFGTCKIASRDIHIILPPETNSQPSGKPTKKAPSTINPLKWNTFGEVIDAVAYVLLFLSLIFTPLLIIIGGFLMTTGVPKNQLLGKKLIIYSLAIFAAILLIKWITSLTKGIIG